MSHSSRRSAIGRRALLGSGLALPALALAACSGTDDASESAGGGSEASDGGGAFPLSVEHALGTAEIPAEPTSIACVNWGNHEVPLALGVVPVGMAAANFGDDDGDGVLPWVSDRLEELGAETPVLFDETDGIDFEAVANTEPDLILATYSGLTQEDYDTLSEIAPTIAYPEVAWGTPWREMIEYSAKGMGMQSKGEKLIADLEKEISDAVEKHSGVTGKSAMFLTHVDTSDLSVVNFYTAHDTRPMFFEDLGMSTPKSIAEVSAKTDEFSGSVSAEKADVFDDVDIIVTYGDEKLVKTLQGDPVLSQIPAVKNDAIVALPSDDPFGTAANPTPLSISYVLDRYLDELEQAAGK
ncbi:iron-siderophore ABC transporter substrate-binding protein [Brachybacterium kimchii]|uniref:Iron-siderophore ABC transporter substrate-binding protein n=1 Tax=Brachybacterium kimchii TaxID=2942909 RepID=A0ABY4N4P1_9MICO|nr:iron-siderophore ABC transporter substrate-binding protein [Brachybacterium kimchii]UQN29534.1 iron-siderophore ABC transporter substrate-binding protein [Brachybacterium kimchii]